MSLQTRAVTVSVKKAEGTPEITGDSKQTYITANF